MWLSDNAVLFSFRSNHIFDDSMDVVRLLRRVGKSRDNTKLGNVSFWVKLDFSPILFVFCINKSVIFVFFAVQNLLYHLLVAFTCNWGSSPHFWDLFDAFEETFTCYLWFMDALGNSSPFVIAMIFTFMAGNICKFASEEMAALSIFIHIDSRTNLASG